MCSTHKATLMTKQLIDVYAATSFPLGTTVLVSIGSTRILLQAPTTNLTQNKATISKPQHPLNQLLTHPTTLQNQKALMDTFSNQIHPELYLLKL